jgi:hypothetical protein
MISCKCCTVRTSAPVEGVDDGVCVLAQTRREHHNVVPLRHRLKEDVDVRPLVDEELGQLRPGIAGNI